jgi:flagella basal body P-ring formation protein FlgA
VQVVKKTKHQSHKNVSAAQVRRAEKVLTQSVRQSLRSKSREASKWFLDVVVDPSDAPIVLAGATEGFEFGAIDPTNVNPQNVDVHGFDSQGRSVRFQIQCVVSEKPQVPVLSRSMSSGEVIREDDLGWKQVDNTEGLLTKVEEIVGKEAKKGLHADDPLRADDVRTIPLVRSNDIVTGIWQKGGIRIMEQFKAKSDGGKGDVITLIQLTGREQVLGKVVDVHEAMIVSADTVRTTKTEVADDDDDPAALAPAPVQTVAHRASARKKRKRPAPSSVINADGVFPASSESGLAGVPAMSAAAENDVRTLRGEPSAFSSR